MTLATDDLVILRNAPDQRLLGESLARRMKRSNLILSVADSPPSAVIISSMCRKLSSKERQQLR